MSAVRCRETRLCLSSCHVKAWLGRNRSTPRLVGSGVQVLLYSMFWVLVLAVKFLFNFFFMIRPLVESTRTVWDLDIGGR